jgi:hypothetical protein
MSWFQELTSLTRLLKLEPKTQLRGSSESYGATSALVTCFACTDGRFLEMNSHQPRRVAPTWRGKRFLRSFHCIWQVARLTCALQ